jgi:hypothetical protein
MPIVPWDRLIDEAGEAAEEYGVLPAADYDLKITKAEAKMSSNGKLMYAITCEVTEGPYKGRKVWSNLVLTRDNPTALGFFFRHMAAIGIDKSYFKQNPSDAQVADALLGREFRAQLSIRQYQGQDRNDIKSYHPKVEGAPSATAPPPPPMPTAPVNPQPAVAQPSTPTAPATQPAAAATSPAAPAPAVGEPAPEPPAQPAVPPVPDVDAAPTNGTQPAEPIPAPAPPPAPQPTTEEQNVPAPPPPAPF